MNKYNIVNVNGDTFTTTGHHAEYDAGTLYVMDENNELESVFNHVAQFDRVTVKQEKRVKLEKAYKDSLISYKTRLASVENSNRDLKVSLNKMNACVDRQDKLIVQLREDNKYKQQERVRAMNDRANLAQELILMKSQRDNLTQQLLTEKRKASTMIANYDIQVNEKNRVIHNQSERIWIMENNPKRKW